MYGRGPSPRDDIASHRGGQSTLAQLNEWSEPRIFFKMVASPELRCCERAPDPSASYTAPSARTKSVAASVYNGRRAAPANHPGPYPGNAIATCPGYVVVLRVQLRLKNDLDKKENNSVSRLKLFNPPDDESKSKFYIPIPLII